MGGPKLNISDWHQREPERVSPREPSSSNRSCHRVLGVVGTLALHAALVQTLILGNRVPKERPPEVQGPGAVLIKSESDSTEPLVLIQLSVIDGQNKALAEDLKSMGSALKDQLLTIVSPDALPHIDIASDEIGDSSDPVASVDKGDPAARAALFGRYTGQIDARIERVWKRPRTPVTPIEDTPQTSASATSRDNGNPADDFKCQVRIIQDHRGAVQEVQVIDCNGSVEWQQSLVRAIVAASPLPAPPSTTVFTNALDMTFESHAYTAASVADDYELARM